MVNFIIDLAHIIEAKVIGEGIEELDQGAYLASSGYDDGQGFLYSRPLDQCDFQRFLLE